MNSREIWETALSRWSDLPNDGYKRFFVAILAENIAYDTFFHQGKYDYFEKHGYAEGQALERYSRILNINWAQLQECIFKTLDNQDMEYMK